MDDQGYIIVADSGISFIKSFSIITYSTFCLIAGNNRIQVFTADGVFVKAFGCWGSGDGEFKVYTYIIVDSSCKW